MKEYEIEVEYTVHKTVVVNANTPTDALWLVRKAIFDGEAEGLVCRLDRGYSANINRIVIVEGDE